MARPAEGHAGRPQGYKVFGAVILILVAAILVGVLITSLFVERPFPFRRATEPVHPTAELPPTLEGEYRAEPASPVPAETPRGPQPAAEEIWPPAPTPEGNPPPRDR